MPAPKRGSASPDLQPKIRKLDEDGEALSATIESTTNFLKTENKQENTAAAPRTKKKRLAVEQGNTPDKSSKQGSPPKDSSKTTPDPPVKKAKLLNTTSASCEETPSQRANSKVSLKRTTSTDSDEDLSSDGSKVDFFRERDDEDKARCIRKYSNKVKAMRKAEESSSDPQEISQDLSSSPLDPVQIDHNYGRFSESTSLENTGEDEDKDSAESFTEQRSKEISHDETQKVQTDTLVSEIGSTETSVKVESAIEKGKYVELQYPESQTLMDNKTPASSREMADCTMPVGEENEKQDETEFIKSQNDAENTLALSDKTLCAVTGELNSSGEGVQQDERTDSVCWSASQTHLITQFVSDENAQNIKSKTKEQEVSEASEICAEKLDVFMLAETNSAPEQVEISNAEDQPEENVKMAEFVTISNTQIDLNYQVASKEEHDATNIQAEMPDTVISSCDDVNKTLKKSEDKFEGSTRDGVDFQSPQTSACSEALVEVHLNHGIVTPDSCTDTLSVCMLVQNQIEMLSDNFKVPEGQTPEVGLQSEQHHLIYEKVTKVAAETESDSSDKHEEKDKSIQCSAAEIKGDAQTSHPDATGKTQNQDAYEATIDSHEAHGGDNFKTRENEDTVDAECGSEAEIVVIPEISNSEAPVEMQKQEIQEVSESTTVTSTEISSNAMADKCENMKTVECAVIVEGQSGMDTVAAFKLSGPEAELEFQIQESPVSEHTAVVPQESQEDPENANSKSRNDVECVNITAENLIEVDIQTTAMSEEVCTQMEETHSQMNEEVSECTSDICATQSQIKFDGLSATTSEEVSNIAHIEDMQTPTVSEPTSDIRDEAQRDLENAHCASQSQIEVVEDVQFAAASDKVSNIASIEETQTPMVSEPTTDRPDDAHTALENAAFRNSKDVKCVSAFAQSQIEVDVDTAASEKVSNFAPIEVIQSQMDMQPPDNSSRTAFAVETQTQKIQDVSGQTTDDTNKELHEDTMVENLQNVKNENVVNLECVLVQEDQLESEMQITPDSVVSEADHSEEIQKSQNEMDMLTTSEQDCNIPAVAIQNLKSHDVNAENTDTQSVADEESQKKMETLERSFSPPSAETQNQRSFNITESSMDVSEKVQENFRTSTNESFENENKATEECFCAAVKANKMEIQTSERLQENLQPTKQIESQRGQEVSELTTDTKISVSQTSSEAQIQTSFSVTDPENDTSETVQESFRVPSNECHEDENMVIKESVSNDEWTNKMETQTAELLEEVSQPTAMEQTQSQRGLEVTELTTDISVLPPSPEAQIQRNFEITEPASEVYKTVQGSFKRPSDECYEIDNKAIEEVVDDEMTNKMEMQTAETLEVSLPTTSDQTQSQRGQELSELTTDANISVLSPSSEIQIQKSLNVESATNISETVQKMFRITSNDSHENENEIAEKSVNTTKKTNEMETQAAEMSLEVSQPATTEKRQNPSGQEVNELTTDTNISSSEAQIQKSFSLTNSENDASETVQESFRIPSNEHHENENKVTKECADTAEWTNKMEIHAVQMLEVVSQPTVTEQTQTLRDQEVSEVTTDADICVSPASAETQIHIRLDNSEATANISETVQEVFRIPLKECHENKAIEEFADTTEMTNKMEIQTTEAAAEIFQPTTTEQTQNQRGQEVGELTTDTDISVSSPSAEPKMEKRISITEPTNDLSKTVQENFKIPPNETNENENEAIKKCVDTAEMMNEMEMQTEAVVEIFQPTTTEHTQNQRGQEVSELIIVTDMSVSPPSAETKMQKISITDPTNDLPKTNQENFSFPPKETNENENKAIEEHVHSAERTNKMEMQPAELLQEISQPTITEQSQNQRNQEVCELTTDTEVEDNSFNTEYEENKNSVNALESHPKIAKHTSSTPEIYYHKYDVEFQNQKNEVSEVCKIEDEDPSVCENVPEIKTNTESSAESIEISYPVAVVKEQNHLAKETTEHTTNLPDEIQTPCPIVNLENKENDRQTEPENVQGDAICGTKQRTESALEEDIKVDASVSNTEGGGAERSEVIVFVCDQSEDTNIAIQAPEGQNKMVNQSEVDFCENQVVYEPISSPESNSGGEVCTIQLGETISFLDFHSAETHQILGEESNVLTSDDKLKITHPDVEDKEIVKKEMCASDSQAVVLMEVETTSVAQCPAHAHLEQSNMTDDVKHIAAVRSSDINLADGQSQDATEKSERCDILECISAAELTEQVQEDTGVQDATSIMATTAPPPTEVEITDASSEEYVILEPVPVPESEIHFDIVTQAAAESGLSASLGPDEEMTSQSILNSSQQTVMLEAGAHQCETTDEVKETTATSSGEVLEQETETNCLQDAQVSDHQPPSATVDVDMAHSDHANKDNNVAVMENFESVVDQEEVQILEDMEIGREIVVAEEDNEEDSDVVVITKPPNQPIEGSPKKSEEEVNDEKKQDTSKIVKKISVEKIEDEKKGPEVEKPKKQEMNMQARTKARLAALAEQKAAAAKRSANRQQLNLLALCQEIAEDIATDSMLLKKIEEEKQAAAAAAAAAAEAAKAEAIKKEHPAVISQEVEPNNVATPAGPEESSASVTPTPEPPAAQPSTADSAETKPAAEPPKRRFFISQISVPLKAHEKKKLTRYQRLRQVELQREKMSWARVKKLKSDQTNQMFSDVDWQASFSGSFLMSSTTPPPAAASPSKTPSVSPATTTQPAQPKGDSPKIETSISELVKTAADKMESIKTENLETGTVTTETTETEPTKAETSKAEHIKTETSKTEPAKAESTKTEAPNLENRRITRQSKAQASQAAAVAPKPAPKVTRSTSKRTLPAVPPPMPNGLNAQKQKPVEYKPYRPRPKYSFDDFELDDDDSLLVSPIKPNLPMQPPRPVLQPSPTAHAKPPLKPTISSQPANQAKLKSQTAPPGQISAQSRPTAAAQAHLQSAKSKPTVTATAQLKPTTAASSKPVPSTSTQLKTPLLAASQSKPISASAHPKPAASASAPLKTAGVNVTKQFAPTVPQLASSAATETKPAAVEADDASVPQKTENLPSQESEKCKNTADPLSSLPASSLPSVESPDDVKKCEESPADTTAPNSSADYKNKTAKMTEKTENRYQDSEAKPQDAATFLSDASLQKEVKKLKEADKDSTQTIIDAGQKHFGPVACSGCGMLYSATNHEDESQHLLFHNQFISAVKYVGWKKERILAEYPDGKIILVLPDDPKYALKKVEEIREMVDNDLGFQQVETKCPSKTKTFLFISIDKKVAGCLIAEHIQEGYRVIEEPLPEGSEGEKVLFERQKAWCCSTTPEPAICGISRIWVASMTRRQGIATRMIECLRNNFIYGSYLRKDEIAFSDPTPDGKLFASHYFGTSQFLVYNFVSGPRSFQPKTQAV